MSNYHMFRGTVIALATGMFIGFLIAGIVNLIIWSLS